jgi:hypothetical protein
VDPCVKDFLGFQITFNLGFGFGTTKNNEKLESSWIKKKRMLGKRYQLQDALR